MLLKRADLAGLSLPDLIAGGTVSVSAGMLISKRMKFPSVATVMVPKEMGTMAVVIDENFLYD